MRPVYSSKEISFAKNYSHNITASLPHIVLVADNSVSGVVRLEVDEDLKDDVRIDVELDDEEHGHVCKLLYNGTVFGVAVGVRYDSSRAKILSDILHRAKDVHIRPKRRRLQFPSQTTEPSIDSPRA